MHTDQADFTRTVAAMVAENDRVPTQRAGSVTTMSTSGLTTRLRELAAEHDPVELVRAVMALWPLAVQVVARPASLVASDPGAFAEPIVEAGEIVGYRFSVEDLRARDAARDVTVLVEARRLMAAEMAAADAVVAAVHDFPSQRGRRP